MTTVPNAPRTAAQVTALRRYAMTFAWQRARHVVSCYRPGFKDLRTEACALLALGWREAKLAEKHDRLVVREVAHTAPASRSTTFVLHEIEDLENRDRLGPSGIDRLAALRSELASAPRLGL